MLHFEKGKLLPELSKICPCGDPFPHCKYCGLSICFEDCRHVEIEGEPYHMALSRKRVFLDQLQAADELLPLEELEHKSNEAD